MKLSPRPYDLISGERMGTRLDLPDGSLVLLERHEINTLTWPTRLRPYDFFKVGRSIVQLGAPALEVFPGDEMKSPSSVDDLEKLDEHQEAALYVVRLEDERSHTSLVWQHSLYEENHTEGGAASKSLRDLDVVSLLGETGTPAVVDAAEDIAGLVLEHQF